MNLLDIVIVNYKSTDYLLACLRSIYDALREVPAKVFVQDNASGDDVDRVNAMFPQVLLSKNTCNMGFAKGINRALEQGSAPYILILNPDTIVKDGFFESVLHYIEENSDVGIVGPKILDRDGSVQGSARSFPTPLTALFGRNSLLTRIFPNNRIARANILTTGCDGRTPMQVDWVSGACFVVRRRAVEDVGLLDERFFIYWEDADWCRRMWQSGWKVVYYPEASIVHYVGGSSEKNIFRSVLEFHKSCYRLFEKYNKPSLRFVTPLVIGGIGLRLCIVLFSNGIRIWLGSFESLMKHREADFAAEDRDRIKVLRMIARLNIGGPAIHAHLLTQGLDGNKFDTILVTGKISPQEGDMSYLFDSSGRQPIVISELQREISLKMDLAVLFQIFKLLRHEKPDIVHTHTAKAGTIGRIAVFIYNRVQSSKLKAQSWVRMISRGRVAGEQSTIDNRQCKVVHTFHGYVFRGYFGKLKSLFFLWTERLLAKVTDVIIAISESQKSELCSKYNIAPASKFRTVKLGFDLEPFFSAERLKGQFKKSLGIDSKTILVGIVGRLVPIKNHKMFFKSAKIFLDQNPDIDVKLVVVGDGKLRNALEHYCRQEELSDRVVFCGWVRDLPKVYADLDILALTSINEGTPVSIIEAMGSSVPVISTDAGGVRDLLGAPVQHMSSNGFQVHERGILCQQGDTKGLAMGLQYIMKNAELRQEIVRSGRQFVEQSFSKERLLQDIESLYVELLEGELQDRLS